MLVSTSTLGGHVGTIGSKDAPGRRRRRLHSDEFKADAVAAAAQPGMSMAAVAMARGINANLLRRWVRDAETPPVKALPNSVPASSPAAFVAVQMPAPAPTPQVVDIRVELRRGPTTITVAWPMAALAECASWMRELLR
jgi:transposase